MKLLLKHIFRSIGKKPLQPLIIVLTLALAMTTSIFAFTIADTMEAELDASQMEKYGHARFMISLGNSSESRFLFADDVVDVLGEDALVVGCYELPLILVGTESTTIAMATEFDRVGDLFDIEFLEYGKVTEGSVGDVAFISSAFAQEHQLTIGDALQVETMGYSKTYRIEGIAERAFLASYDVMVDIRGLVRAFAGNSLLFAAIGEDFKPCSRLYVSVDDSDVFETHIDAVTLLKQSPRFADKVFTDELRHAERRQVNFPVLELIIKFAVALAALLSGVVVFCCFYILANERAEENQTLAYSGAGPKLLGAMQYIEVAIYWFLGSLVGAFVAIPVTQLIPHFVDFQYITVSVKPEAILKSVCILFGVCMLTTMLFVVISKRTRRTGETHKTIPAKWIVYLLLTVGVLLVLMYLLPANPRLTVFVIAMLAIIALVFCAVPFLVERVSKAFEKRIQKAKKPTSVALRYAFKNICSVKLLHNIARLCALIVLIVLTVYLVFAGVHAQVKDFEHVFNADYVVLNATDSCYQKTQACQSAKNVYRAYMAQTDWGLFLSSDDTSGYADWMMLDCQPTGNEAVISIGVADTHDLKVGDTLPIIVFGAEYELVVSKILYAACNVIVVDCEDVGIPYNMLLVEGQDGITSAELLGDLSQTTASELAPIAEADSLLERFIGAIQMYMDAGKILLVVFICFSLIGMVDVFYESLRARREEFELYRLAGMEKRELRLMKVSELTITILLGVMIGLGAFVISAFVVNRGLSARGMEVFINILSLMR